MAEDKAAEGVKEEAPAGPKMILGMPMLTFLFVVVNVVVMAGAFAFIVQASLFYKKPAITDAQATAEITKAAKKAIDTGDDVIAISYPEMTVTLRGEQGGKTRYATLEATIICGSDDCKAQVDENKAKIQDAIQTVLGARSYTELTSLETKFRVKHEILNQVNSFLTDTAAVDLLFTSFLVQ